MKEVIESIFKMMLDQILEDFLTKTVVKLDSAYKTDFNV